MSESDSLMLGSPPDDEVPASDELPCPDDEVESSAPVEDSARPAPLDEDDAPPVEEVPAEAVPLGGSVSSHPPSANAAALHKTIAFAS